MFLAWCTWEFLRWNFQKKIITCAVLWMNVFLIKGGCLISAAHCDECNPLYVVIGAHNYLQPEPLRQVKAAKNFIKVGGALLNWIFNER